MASAGYDDAPLSSNILLEEGGPDDVRKLKPPSNIQRNTTAPALLGSYGFTGVSPTDWRINPDYHDFYNKLPAEDRSNYPPPISPSSMTARDPSAAGGAGATEGAGEEG